MAFDLHPIIVHFPIALLVIYSVLELIRFKSVLSQPYWFYVKASFVIVGAIATPFALLTGGIAEDKIEQGPLSGVLEAHSSFAGAMTIVFAIIAVGYLLAWLSTLSKSIGANKLLRATKDFLQRPIILIILAAIGLVLAVCTGALGGGLAYKCSPDIEPLVTLGCKLFM